MKIVVLAGGLSPEREVSLSSGSLIANSLINSGHEVLLLDLYKGAKTDDESQFCDHGEYRYHISEAEPDLAKVRAENENRNELIGKNVISLCKKADVVFLALHGSIGENGQLQATLDNFGIKYTGSGYIGSLLAMNKDIAKKMMRFAGIVTADWMLYDNNAADVGKVIGFPCVIKPCSCGSSVGVSIVNNREELDSALTLASKYEDEIMIERLICGREFSVGILDNEVLPPIEIIPKNGFYDYKNKYQSGCTEEICPAELSDDDTEAIKASALAVHKALRLGGYSRIDFIRSDLDREFYCLEANTLPGMTPMSLLPKEAAASGISFDRLCEKIAMLPLEAGLDL